MPLPLYGLVAYLGNSEIVLKRTNSENIFFTVRKVVCDFFNCDRFESDFLQFERKQGALLTEVSVSKVYSIPRFT